MNVDHDLPLEAIEFPTEASTSKEQDFWELYESKKEEKQNQVPTSFDIKPMEPVNSTKTGKNKEEKVSPLKYTPETSKSESKNMKRKVAEEECTEISTKKPRRVLKMKYASRRVKAWEGLRNKRKRKVTKL